HARRNHTEGNDSTCPVFMVKEPVAPVLRDVKQEKCSGWPSAVDSVACNSRSTATLRPMSHRVLIIGAGGVGRVVTHKCAQLPDVFSEIMLASRTQSKCDGIAAELKRP